MAGSTGAVKTGKPLAPFILTAFIIILDQITKWAIHANVRQGRIGWSAFGDFFWLVHQKNTGAAFSLGDTLSGPLRLAVLILVPLALMVFLVVYYFRTDELTPVQRWALAGIVGGGVGNLIDRAFRPDGVIDFLSFKFYGLFGLERWPTFNVADSSVVVCGFLLVIAGFFIAPAGGHDTDKAGDNSADTANHSRTTEA